MYTEIDRKFIKQAELFSQLALEGCGKGDDLLGHARLVRPILLRNIESLTQAECDGVVSQYNDLGISYFIAADPLIRLSRHPLFIIAQQLRPYLNLQFPLEHPLENHSETIARFGRSDGTVKIYNLVKTGSGYREQGETSEMFEMHHDGLGSGGTVEIAMLYMDQPPVWGGLTFFQNIVRISMKLRENDPEAFESLFLPNALTIIRPRGKGAIKVTTPVLYVNESRRPQSAFRRASGEYMVHWRKEESLYRARTFLLRHTEPFASGSLFVNFSAPGHGCIMRNESIAHGRTDFLDEVAQGKVRILSRKWFMRSADHSVYKHVPGISILPEYSSLVPELFGSDKLSGEWSYVMDSDVNVRIR